MTARSAVAVVAFVLALAACCDSSGGPALQDGVYEYEVSKQYLLDNGISEQQADTESGVHQTTLDNGSFVDRWRTAAGRTGSCSGTTEADGNEVTFRWKSGCFGDWKMSYSVDGDTVRWSDIEALPPATDEDQKVTEVFNGVLWRRVGDVPTG
jgi:hypothetical protein